MTDYSELPLCSSKLWLYDGKIWLVLPMPQLTILFILPPLSPILFIHLVTYSLIIFILIKSFSAWQSLNFIIIFIGLLLLLIYLISAISFLLYNYCKYIKPTISYFSYIILSLIKQLYRDFKLV